MARAAWRPWASASMCTVVRAGVASAPYPLSSKPMTARSPGAVEAEVAHGREDAQRHVVVEGRDGGHRRVGGAEFRQGVGRARSEYRD